MFTVMYSIKGTDCTASVSSYHEGVLLVEALTKAGVFATLWQGMRLVRTREAA